MKRLLCGVLLVLVVACDKDRAPTPTPTQPSPQPPTQPSPLPPRFALRGVVTESGGGRPVPGVLVETSVGRRR